MWQSHCKEMNKPSQSSQQWRDNQERGVSLMGVGRCLVLHLEEEVQLDKEQRVRAQGSVVK